ncbi:MAG: cytochrome c oxidase assembly protein [Acidimicrobiales bacterium]
MPGMSKVHFSLHSALTAWQWSPFSVCVPVALVVIGYFYLRGDWRLASRGRRWPARRTVPFLAGLVAVDLALQSPVATFTASYFQAHVAQHLLLMVVAPPLLALGAPSTLLLQTASRANKKRWLAVLRSRPFAVATHPVLVWFFYFGAMFAFFLSPLLNFAMEHMALMDAINLAFLLGGTFYWWPMVGLDPIVHWKMGYGARLANLAIGVPFEAFLGIAIMSQRAPIASMYTLASTQAGGALLWAATEVATFTGMVPIVLQWVRADDRAGRRADDRAARRAPAPLRPRADLASADLASGDLALADLARAREPRAPVPLLGERVRPLFQPGNSSWEAMWRAKAGFVPSSLSRSEDRARAAGDQDGGQGGDG